MDAELVRAMDRVADGLDTLADAVRESAAETRGVRGVCDRILEAIANPDGASPVADALRALADTVAALDAAQGALVPEVREVMTALRLWAQKRNGL